MDGLQRSLRININDLPNCDVLDTENLRNVDKSTIWTKHCYGEEISIRVAGREGGYHSNPHVHDSEQMNFCAEGEVWIYVEEKGYQLRKGDLMRVPRNVVHWAWNRSDKPCVLYESHSPPNIGLQRVRDTAGPLFDPDEPLPEGRYPKTIWLSTDYAEAPERANRPSEEGGLLARGGEVKDTIHRVLSKEGGFRSKFTYGFNSSFLIGTQAPGSRIRAHLHDCEQLLHIVSGELWTFLPDKAFHLKAGDFMRVPRMMPHWSWNPGSAPCQLFEAHTPGLDMSDEPNAHPLIDKAETPPATMRARTLWAPNELMDREQDLVKKAEAAR